MSNPVFISYARTSNASHARALSVSLGDLAFLDAAGIDDGDQFPDRLLKSILEARIVVIFATKAYAARRFCRLEMRLALAGGDDRASHIVVAVSEESDVVLDALPVVLANQNWPSSEATDKLEALVRRKLNAAPISIGATIAVDDARALGATFLEESKLPEASSLHGILCSFPQGVALQSIGSSFVGRAETLRAMHRFLANSGNGTARLTSRIA